MLTISYGQLSEEAGFGRSLFERLSLMGHPKHLLDMQYRMHPSISQFPNSNFYSNQIKDASNVLTRSYEKCYLEARMFGPYSFINIDGGQDESDDIGHSRRNMVEVAVIVKLVQKLFKGMLSSAELSLVNYLSLSLCFIFYGLYGLCWEKEFVLGVISNHLISLRISYVEMN